MQPNETEHQDNVHKVHLMQIFMNAKRKCIKNENGLDSASLCKICILFAH